MELGEEEMAKAMLASGLIGVFIATRWTFAAEVGGCQAEGGSAASMAAAALVGMADGTLAQSVAAASMAFQSMLGLICDPIANRVEVPCLGKNVMAASNALACANMALAGYDPVIPLDEVIETAQRVAGQMPRELRCTALGGLSITPTSQAIEAAVGGEESGRLRQRVRLPLTMNVNMKQDEATLNTEGQSNGNPSVRHQAFSKAVFLPAVALGLLTLCLSCAHLSAKPVLVVFETELGNITVEVDVVHVLKAYRKQQTKAEIHAQAEARDKASNGGIQRDQGHLRLDCAYQP